MFNFHRCITSPRLYYTVDRVEKQITDNHRLTTIDQRLYKRRFWVGECGLFFLDSSSSAFASLFHHSSFSYEGWKAMADKPLGVTWIENQVSTMNNKRWIK